MPPLIVLKRSRWITSFSCPFPLLGKRDSDLRLIPVAEFPTPPLLEGILNSIFYDSTEDLSPRSFLSL
jgi:hypothetical protein